MRRPWSRFWLLGRSTRLTIGSASTRLFSSGRSGVLKFAAVVLFAVTPALAQQAVQVWNPLGFQRLAGPWVTTPFTLTTGTTLTVPQGARWALICAEGQVVRWRDDGVSPTQTIGMPLLPVTSNPAGSGSSVAPVENNCITYSGALTTQSTLSPPTTPGAIQFTPSTSGASLNVTYYR